MGECKAGLYKSNSIVTHTPLMCFGGLGQPTCQYLKECMDENGFKLRVRRAKK
jgi:hypothetical protein